MSATISQCGLYRYTLDRAWANGRTITFVGVNPSTADAAIDDATVRRWRGFSERWGYVGFTVVNLFDTMPPADPTYTAYPYYDISWFDTMGRTYYLQYTHKFGGAGL